MEKTKKRAEIPEEYKWDLTMLVKNDADYQEKKIKIKELLEKIISLKGHLFDSAANLLKYCQTSTEMNKIIQDLYVWANIYKYQDLSDTKATEYSLDIEDIYNQVLASTSFVSAEIVNNDIETYNKFSNELEELNEFRFQFENIFKEKEHILSEREEEIISFLTRTYGKSEEAYEILSDSENTLGTIEIDGKEIQITQSNYVNLLKNSDGNIRKQIFETYYRFYKHHKNTYASLYATNVMEDNTIAELRKFSNSLAMALNHENISEDVYKNLLDAVNNNLNLSHDYLKTRADILGLKEFHLYDNYLEYETDEKEIYQVEKCKDIIKEALKPLGEDYIKKLNFMFDSKYIDYYPNENKRSGAFQWNRYVCLNHLDSRDSLTTMAHELGHALNTLYTEENQPLQYQDNPIFLAEIASTCNEVLLTEYMYQNAKTKEEKKKILLDFLSRVNATIYRQTMFAEFEYIIHQKEQDKVPLTEELMSTEYKKLVEKYFGNDTKIDEDIKYEWMRISHFYSSYYVYKYAIGLICSLIFAKRILNKEENATVEYITFLSSGTCDYPLNILKKANIDLTDKKVFDEAFLMIKEKLNELKEVNYCE